MCWFIINRSWAENKGSQSSDGKGQLNTDAALAAVKAIRADPRIMLIGTIAALFEGSMYTFVFLWSPMLQQADRVDLPYGVIFAVFMLSCMCGSNAFSILSKKMPVTQIGSFLLLAAASALAVPFLTHDKKFLMASFMVFEFCVGMYWPVIGTLKGIYVPEAQRSAIYNVFRVPLNAIVLFVLLVLGEMDNSVAALGCSVLLGAAFLLNRTLISTLALGTPVSTVEIATAV